MTALIHVLGADIPHHNQTLLQFFNDTLAAGDARAQHFMLVSPAADSAAMARRFPALRIRCFADQKSLARALIATARTHRQHRFLLHGQFNRWLWLALLSGVLRGSQFSWHIWGADLYETASGWRYRLFYWLRRHAQRRIARVFATRGDLHHFAEICPQVPGQLLYFPAKMPALPPDSARQTAQNHRQQTHIDQSQTDQSHTEQPQADQPHADPQTTPLTVLVGNSGDSSNQHIAALHTIHRQLGANVRLIVPMGYPPDNDAYIGQVQQVAASLFGADNVRVLRQTLDIDAYWRLLADCQLGYFLFARQQGIGTLCLLIQAGVPCVLNRDNPFWRDMQEQQLPLLFTDQPLTKTTIDSARQQLRHINTAQLAFFPGGCLPLWHQALGIASGDIASGNTVSLNAASLNITSEEQP